MELEQEGYRWRNDTQDETSDGTDWLDTQDTNITRWRNVNTRIRIIINSTGVTNPAAYRLEYREEGTGKWYVVGTGQGADVVSPSASVSPSISPSVSPSLSPSSG